MRFAACLLFSALLSCATAGEEPVVLPGWDLVWRDEFDGNRIDNTKWSPCERGPSDWNDTMSSNPKCFTIGGGILRLNGFANPDKSKDPVDFLTGGVTSKGKFTIQHGKVVIRARFKSARGAWPALWMLGARGGWPHNGEIDIMEHLNHDGFVHQTIHSHWANNIDKKKSIPKTKTSPVARDDWNTYGVEWDKDRITFTVNTRPTFVYPRAPEHGPEQWPFDGPFYLIFSMQIGGKWVGKEDPAEYPAWMDIDWVRVYQPAAAP